MNTTRPMTKSPRAVAREALRLAKQTLPAYSSKYSRQDYTQHQLFALLALKTFFKTDYRGLIQMLADFAELRQDLSLDDIPHYSTLCYAAKRLLKKGSLSCSSSALPRAHKRPA
jgi:hypothetical protein